MAVEIGSVLTQLHRALSVSSPLGEDTLVLHRMHAEEALSRPFTYRLELLSRDHEIELSQLLGENMTVRLDLGSGEQRYFNGFVAEAEEGGAHGDLARYLVTLKPWLWFLTHTRDSRIFQDKDAVEIVRDVLAAHGFSDVEERLSGSPPAHEYLVQYQESDFAFVQRLLEREGVYYYFKHENGSHKLVLCDGVSAHEPWPDYETIPFRPPSGSRQEEEVIIDWRIRKDLLPVEYSLTDFNFKQPKLRLETRQAAEADHALAAFEVYEHPGGYDELGKGEDYVRKRMEEVRAGYERLSGGATARGLSTGFLFTLSEHPRDDQNREYLVLEARYELVSDLFRTAEDEGEEEELFRCSFTALDSRVPFRPSRVTPKPMIRGPQTAIVTGPAGEDIYTDEHGRVKVQFHWDRESGGDESSSCWIRVAQSWAGKRWGAFFLPRIGHEVLVAFLEGDPDRPYVVGSLYNGDARPPEELPDKKTRSGLKSNTEHGGGFNLVRFEDEPGAEHIFIHAEKDFEQRVKNDTVEWIGNERHLIVTKDQLEKVEADKHTSVKGDLVEKVDGTVSLTAGADLQEKVGMNAALDAGMEIHLKAGMSVVVEAGVSLTLKAGGSFVTIGPAGVAVQGPMVLINSGGAPGSGSGSSPDSPKEPREAIDDRPGEVSSVEAPTPPERSGEPSTNPVVEMLRSAHASGAPFCEKCEEARRAREAAAGGGGA